MRLQVELSLLPVASWKIMDSVEIFENYVKLMMDDVLVNYRSKSQIGQVLFLFT